MSGQRTAVKTGLRIEHLAFAFKIGLFGLGLMALWSGVNTTLLPDRVADTAPSSLQGSGVGLISLIGVGLATIVQPIVGRASDNWPFWDRRRPFLIIGTVLIGAGLALFGGASGFFVLLAGYVLLQIAANIAQAAFQAFIPDFVERDERGLASGVKNLLSVIGAAVGLLGVRGLDAIDAGLAWELAYLGAVIVLTCVLTLFWVPRSPPQSGKSPEELRDELNPRTIWRAFEATIREHQVFRLGIAAQFLFLLGTYPAQRYLLLFLRDRFGEDAEDQASIGLALAMVVAIVAAVGAGALSDRIGRKRILIASVIVGALGMALMGFAPTIAIAAVAGAMIGAGVGAFQAVNWALINDDLPEGEDANALGVANVATAGAGAVAGLFGPVVDGMEAILPHATYHVTFGLAALVALLSLIPLGRVPAKES
jgi:MFS family permease